MSENEFSFMEKDFKRVIFVEHLNIWNVKFDFEFVSK